MDGKSSTPASAARAAWARRGRTTPWVLAALLVATVMVAASVQAQSFVPGGDLDVLVGGTLDPAARLYESAADAAVLVMSTRLPGPVLLHVRSRGVQSVPPERLRAVGEGYDIVRGNPLAELGSFQVEGSEVRFSHGGKAVALRPKPALVGLHTLDELFAHTPKYKVDAAAYRPDAALIERLRGVGADVRVTVVFGSWCSVCKHFLPRGLAVDLALQGAPLRFEYVGLPLEDPWNNADVKRLGVQSLPTAIVYRGSREVGRFAGAEEWDRPEAKLWDAISRSSP